jgi:hypothetical protein
VAERVLTERELNRALLARQMLLERAPLTVGKAAERMAFVQSQYAPSTYVGLWSRVEGLTREDVTRALERRTLIQATLLRATIHSVSRRDYWPAVAAIERGRRDRWLRATRHTGSDAEIRKHADRVRKVLEAEGPQRRNDLIKRLTLDTPTWNGIGMWLDMVRVPPSGTWEQRRADLYGLAEEWVGPRPPGLAAEQGIELLVKRYLGGFGPAAAKDIVGWAGLDMKDLNPVLASMKLRTFRDGSGAELLDLPKAPLPDPDTPAPVRFLPTWDASLLVHARRSQILPERYRARIFDSKNPHSFPVFLVDGQVAGTWKEAGGRIDVRAFQPLSASVRKEMFAEIERSRSFFE